MKNLNKAILIAIGMSLPLGVMASPDDDVTIRMMQADERAGEAVTSNIELPEAADDHAREHAAKGLEMANSKRNGEHDKNDDDRDHEMDRDQEREHEMERDEEREHEMEREEEREHEMEREMEYEREIGRDDRDDRKDIEHDGRDREEVERDSIEFERDHDSNFEIEAPEAPEAPEHDGDFSSQDRR